MRRTGAAGSEDRALSLCVHWLNAISANQSVRAISLISRFELSE